MTLRLQPGRFLVLVLCLLLALFGCIEAAHGHLAAGDHCPLCLLAHNAALLPALLALPRLLLLFTRRTRVAPCLGSRLRIRAARIRPPPAPA